ncbi:MAG TPA: MFS transporter [Methylomirabilota bacterium]|jgi:UMF1 family MFS transporter|nr:MFS transporter [Methylomirabilota bacterium]
MALGRADRPERVGWYFYDWANSAFSTTVVTVFMGPYLTTVTKAAADPDGFVRPLGIAIYAGSFFPYVVSLSVLLQVFLLPLLGAISDYSRGKKPLLGFFAFLGAAATAGLYFLHGTNYLLGGLLFLVANLSFGASVVVYNAFLPEIAGPDQRDAVSSMGWALGYLGGGLLLALNLLMFANAERLGLTAADAARVSLASAGVWWGVFTLIPMLTLKTRQAIKPLPPGESYLSAGFRQLGHTLRTARNYPHTLLFLVAFLCYNDGVQTVINMSSQFGQEELGLPLATLTQIILMVQFVAFFGALLFNQVAKVLGSKRAIMLSLVIWTGTVVYAYALLQTRGQFFVLGAVIAIVLGGSQALSRSVYSLMIPRGREAEYFSLYEVSERGTSWLGPLLFGLALQFSGSYRVAILSVVVFFVAGLALLARVNVRKAAIEAGNPPPSRT